MTWSKRKREGSKEKGEERGGRGEIVHGWATTTVDFGELVGDFREKKRKSRKKIIGGGWRCSNALGKVFWPLSPLGDHWSSLGKSERLMCKFGSVRRPVATLPSLAFGGAAIPLKYILMSLMCN